MDNGEDAYDGIEIRSVEELTRSIDRASDGSYAFLVGAGVSRPEPAEISTAGELIEKFQTELYEEYSPDGQDLDEWAEEFEEENKADGENSYGFWFSKARPTPGNRREEIEDLVEETDPPFGQIILASMMDEGIISNTITPNFDNLLFKAFYQYADERPFLVDHHAKAPQFRLSDGRSAIVKVHGDYLHYTQNTAEETAELDEGVRELFEQTINEYGMIVVGYGGTDDSIMSVLERETISEHGLFWCQRKGSPLSNRVENLLRESDNAYVVWIEGSESLFGSFWSEIERVSLPQPDDLMERAERRRDRVQQRKDEYLGEKSTTTSDPEDERGAELKNILWEARKAGSDGEYEEVIKIADKAIGNGIENAKLYEYRGTAYARLDEYERAIEDYDQAIDLDAERAQIYGNRGLAYARLDEYEMAIEDYDQSIDLDPTDALTYNNRGHAYTKLDEYDRAIEDYEQAIELDQEFVSSYENLAEAQIITGRPKEAKETAKKSLDLSNDAYDIAVSLMLLIISKKLLGEEIAEEKDEYNEVCSESFTAGWSFEELDGWLGTTDLDNEKEEEIRDILDRLRDHKE